MTQLHKTLSTSEPLTLMTRGDDRMERKFKRSRKGFEADMIALLKRAGFGGSFGAVIASSRVKGSAHNKGLRLGAPYMNTRMIEVLWQQFGNDESFAIKVNVPHGVDTMEFHAKLDAVLQEMGDEAEIAKQKAQPAPKPAPQIDAKIINHPAKDRKVVAEEGITPAMRLLREFAPNYGQVSRDDCLEVLQALGEPLPIFELLVSGRHLVAMPGSDELFKIGENWLSDKAASSPVQKSPAAPAPQQNDAMNEVAKFVGGLAPKPAPVAQTPDLLGQLKELQALVQRATEEQARLRSTSKEIEEINTLIAEKTARLRALEAERFEAEEFLTSPEYRKAEEALSIIEQLKK